jgi:hypothetical protein
MGRYYCTIARNNFFITGILVRIDIDGLLRSLLSSIAGEKIAPPSNKMDNIFS